LVAAVNGLTLPLLLAVLSLLSMIGTGLQGWSLSKIYELNGRVSRIEARVCDMKEHSGYPVPGQQTEVVNR
jgi:hypothetical protein